MLGQGEKQKGREKKPLRLLLEEGTEEKSVPRGSPFDLEFTRLLDILMATVQAHNARTELKLAIHPIMAPLNAYRKIYVKHSDPEDHIEYVEDLFDKHRGDILRDDYAWIESKDIVIQYADVKKAKIHLTKIYRMAIQLAVETRAPFRDTILDCLHKLFAIVASEEDRASLEEIAKRKEEAKTKPPTPSPTTTSTGANPPTTDPFSSLLSAFRPVVEGLGIQLPSTQEIATNLQSTLQSPQIQSMLSSFGPMIQSVMQTGDITPLTAMLGEKLGNPNLSQALTETMGSGTVGALEGLMGRMRIGEGGEGDMDQEEEREEKGKGREGPGGSEGTS
jgi:hypothetical protein